MNPMIQVKTTTALFVSVLVLGCCVLLPTAQAVSPPPDGCYPAFTTAEGCDALNLLTTGEANTGVGWRALFSVGPGNFNTAVGAGALVLNTVDANTATGTVACLLNTTGIENTANGAAALEFNEIGSSNTAMGAFALANNTADDNTAVGTQALEDNTSGVTNAALSSEGPRWITSSRTLPWEFSRPSILPLVSTWRSAALRSGTTLVAPETPPLVLVRWRLEAEATTTPRLGS